MCTSVRARGSLAAWMRADQRPLSPAAEPAKTVALSLWGWRQEQRPHSEEHAPPLGPVATPAIPRLTQLGARFPGL